MIEPRARTLVLPVLVALFGCATTGNRRGAADERNSLAGWEALVDSGRSDEAERLFDKRLRAVPADPVALGGRAGHA